MHTIRRHATRGENIAAGTVFLGSLKCARIARRRVHVNTTLRRTRGNGGRRARETGPFYILLLTYYAVMTF